MNIEEANEAVEGLKGSLTEYSNEKVTFVNTTDLRTVLTYIAELEIKVANREKIAVGDEVVVVKDDTGIHTWMIGRAGIVVEIEEDSHLFPLIIEFPSKLRARAHYTEVQKLTKAEEPAVVEAKFKIGQKVETLKEIGVVVKVGTVGTVTEIDPLRIHEFEVMFTGGQGTFSFGFDADELKAV